MNPQQFQFRSPGQQEAVEVIASRVGPGGQVPLGPNRGPGRAGGRGRSDDIDAWNDG